MRLSGMKQNGAKINAKSLCSEESEIVGRYGHKRMEELR
jgi:hypothetical protein